MLLHLYARSKAPTIEQALIESVSQAQGAFSLVLLTKDRLIAVRDPHGFRPLTLGRLGDAYIVCVGDLRARSRSMPTWVRDIEPGEMLVIGPDGEKSYQPFPPAPIGALHLRARLLRPARLLRLRPERRTRCGRSSAAGSPREQPADADVVVPIPDSGVCAATGFAEESGLPLQMGLIRNHYVGRTFIEPHQSIRHFGVRVKLNPVRSILQGQTCRARRRLDRARHDEPQDRQDGPRGRRDAKCTCGSAARRRSRRASTASIRRGVPS